MERVRPTLPSMNRTHSALWGFGLAGMATGVASTALGFLGAGEVAGLASGYGVLVIGTAGYLLIGLKLRERFGRRAPAAASAAITTQS
jgi:hypothetical protein